MRNRPKRHSQSRKSRLKAKERLILMTHRKLAGQRGLPAALPAGLQPLRRLPQGGLRAGRQRPLDGPDHAAHPLPRGRPMGEAGQAVGHQDQPLLRLQARLHALRVALRPVAHLVNHCKTS